MQARIVKELHPLAVPWAMAAAAAVIRSFNFDTESFAWTITSFIFFSGVAILPSISFGTEFQHRTLQLLLAQPLPRAKLWREKMQVLGVAMIPLAVLYWQIETMAIEKSGMQAAVGGLFLLAAVCSAGLWIGRTGSAPIGITLGIVTQVILFSVLHFIIQWFYGAERFFWDWEQLRLVIGTGLVYSGLLVWLGRSFWKTRVVKLGLAVGIALTIYFIYLLVWTGLGRLKPKLTTEEAVWSGAFLVAATCSGCFWTLVARSTVAGVVFNVASQFITGAVAVCAIAKLFPQWLEAPKSFFVIGAIALAYSATFLWLGWSKFARLEIRDTLPATASSFSLSFPWWLRCRPQGALRNFIRKELCLQKSIVTLAALFTVGWILLAGLRYVVPILREPLEGILKLLAPIYAALSLLLAGALSIGEEKTSALNAWHLTLPISAWRQWLLKFAVSSIVGALLSGILPAGYMWLTFGRGAINGSPHELAIIILAAWLILTMSFWASTLTSSTLRSILISMLALAGVFASARLSVWVVHSYSGEIGWSPMPMIIFLLAIIATALAQSLSLFRHPQAREWAWLKCSAILTAVAVVVTVWCTALRP